MTSQNKDLIGSENVLCKTFILQEARLVFRTGIIFMVRRRLLPGLAQDKMNNVAEIENKMTSYIGLLIGCPWIYRRRGQRKLAKTRRASTKGRQTSLSGNQSV